MTSFLYTEWVLSAVFIINETQHLVKRFSQAKHGNSIDYKGSHPLMTDLTASGRSLTETVR